MARTSKPVQNTYRTRGITASDGSLREYLANVSRNTASIPTAK